MAVLMAARGVIGGADAAALWRWTWQRERQREREREELQTAMLGCSLGAGQLCPSPGPATASPPPSRRRRCMGGRGRRGFIGLSPGTAIYANIDHAIAAHLCRIAVAGRRARHYPAPPLCPTKVDSCNGVSFGIPTVNPASTQLLALLHARNPASSSPSLTFSILAVRIFRCGVGRTIPSIATTFRQARSLVSRPPLPHHLPFHLAL